MQKSKAIENAYFRHYLVGGVLSCFQGPLGVFELTFMGDYYDYIAKILVSLHSCVLETLD